MAARSLTPMERLRSARICRNLPVRTQLLVSSHSTHIMTSRVEERADAPDSDSPAPSSKGVSNSCSCSSSDISVLAPSDANEVVESCTWLLATELVERNEEGREDLGVDIVSVGES